MISRVDHQFGQIVNNTKTLGLWESTIIFFFTDHGEFLGDWGSIEKWPSGNLVHDSLIIGGVGLPSNITFEPMVEMIDLVSTFMHFGQVNEAYDQYGRSFVDAIHALGRGDQVVHREYAYSEGGFLLSAEPPLEQGPISYDIKVALQHNDTRLVGNGLAVRDLDWTYIYRLYEADEVYSRANDQDEMHNLASLPEFALVRAKMREVALHWMISTPSPLPWYKDDRKPTVPLDSPYEQFLARGGELNDSEGGCRQFVS